MEEMLNLLHSFKGETQHRTVKKYYSRASKAHPTQSIAKRQRRERTLHKIANRNKAAEANSNVDDHRATKRRRKEPVLDFEDEERLPYTNPEVHYHISSDTKEKINIYLWPDEELEKDVAYKVSMSCTASHLRTEIAVELVSKTFGPFARPY